MATAFKVPFAPRGSLLGPDEAAAVAGIVCSPQSLSAGVWRQRFEARFRDYVGTAHALSVTSGTVALEIAVSLLDLTEGDEVIVAPQTYQAMVQPLLDHPARVRFCDIDPRSLNIDPVILERMLSVNTKAVILVHYGGCPADMSRIMSAARGVGALVIEDCAHALGAELGGRRPGALADIGCFSFHSSKNITTLGEGGMLTFDRDDWAERVDRRRSNEVDATFVARVPGVKAPLALQWMRDAEHIYQSACSTVRRAGTNATLSEAAAAVGLVQMDKLQGFVERRRSIAAALDEVVARQPGFTTVRAEPDARHAYHLYTFLAGCREERDLLLCLLDGRGVEIQLRYFPQHLRPEWALRGHRPGECPVAESSWFDRHMNLPCHPGLSDAQVEYLVFAVEASIREVVVSRARPSHAV